MRVTDQSISFGRLNMPQTTIVEIMTMATVVVMVTRSTIDRDRYRRDDNCTRASSRDQRTLANEAMIRGFRAD